MEMRVGLMGKLVQTCYAVLCLGVVLVSVTVAHYVFSEEMAEDPQERSKRRLRALHGRALHLRALLYGNSAFWLRSPIEYAATWKACV
ncbi:hypothetical protein SAY86_009110 [Trapa natans]|uniref:Uncharacterized protein n=1 Tax=Trapa natans TaxID=22666 RepID=A0AAN7KGR8_TRANT|nr:hypothetical protein SAY86_009110 [Trapa natans]